MLGLETLLRAEDRLIDFVEETKGFQLFVSHDSKDEELARQIKREAESVGVDAWLFEDDNELGTPIRAKIQDAIEGADAFVVLLTNSGDSSVSTYVHQEIGYAEGTDTPVLPMVHKDVDLDNLAMLRGREQVRFNDETVPEAVSELKARAKERSREAAKSNTRGVLLLGFFFLVLKLLPDEEEP